MCLKFLSWHVPSIHHVPGVSSVPGSVLGTEDIAVCKGDQRPCSHGAYILARCLAPECSGKVAEWMHTHTSTLRIKSSC